MDDGRCWLWDVIGMVHLPLFIGGQKEACAGWGTLKRVGMRWDRSSSFSRIWGTLDVGFAAHGRRCVADRRSNRLTMGGCATWYYRAAATLAGTEATLRRNQQPPDEANGASHKTSALARGPRACLVSRPSGVPRGEHQMEHGFPYHIPKADMDHIALWFGLFSWTRIVFSPSLAARSPVETADILIKRTLQAPKAPPRQPHTDANLTRAQVSAISLAAVYSMTVSASDCASRDQSTPTSHVPRRSLLGMTKRT